MNAGTAILQAFYQAPSRFLRADELARQSRLASAAVAAEIGELLKMGYVIEAHPHLGYRLIETPDRLTAEDLQARLRTPVIGAEVLVFQETSSTNDVVERLADGKAREGLVVFAESQTKGRGRHGRPWVSPPGKGLWFSVLLRPQLPAAAVSRITVAASVAVARAVRATTPADARIKWPNDVTVNGRKLAGILTELSGGVAILGIGIDVNCQAAELPVGATSLLIETGERQDRTALAARVLTELDQLYRQAVQDFEAVAREWAGLCMTLGRQIVVTMGHRRIEGWAQALDGDGALLLRKDNGQVERLVGGDLTVERA